MPILGVTGGVATGKTSFTKALLRFIPAEAFDADAAARKLLTSNQKVRQAVRGQFGDSVFSTEGALDRAKLREIVFKDLSKRRELEAILHPLIRNEWIGRAEKVRASGETRWLIVDIPLLFETRAEGYFDAVVVVACSPATQRQRLITLRNLTASMAEQMIASQLDLKVKTERADHVIWNDSTPACLEEQTALFSDYLKNRFS